MGSLNDGSLFYNLRLQSDTCPLVKVPDACTDYACTTTSFVWNENPMCYHSNSEANAAHLRSRHNPVFAYVNDAWYRNASPTFGCSDKARWLSAAEVCHVGKAAIFCDFFVSDTKCDLTSSRRKGYLGILCSSNTTSIRVPLDKLNKVYDFIRQARGAVWYRCPRGELSAGGGYLTSGCIPRRINGQ